MWDKATAFTLNNSVRSMEFQRFFCTGGLAVAAMRNTDKFLTPSFTARCCLTNALAGAVRRKSP